MSFRGVAILLQIAALVSGTRYMNALGNRLRIPIDQTPFEAGTVFPSMAELWLLPVCAGCAVLALVLVCWAWMRPAG